MTDLTKDEWIAQAKVALQELGNTTANNNSASRIRTIARDALFGQYRGTVNG